MLDVLEDRYYRDYATQGFIDTGMVLPAELVEEIRGHYAGIAEGRNDFPKFFEDNEHQAYLAGQIIGTLVNALPGLGFRLVERNYQKTYEKAVYLNQACIPRIIDWLLRNGVARVFKTRYMVAAYDMYLSGHQGHRFLPIHTDLPNFHHFYETENDLSFYIPLVDLDETNGGRLSVLPESKLKVPGNVLLKMLARHFSAPHYLDRDGYLDPGLVTSVALKSFTKSAPYRTLFAVHKYLDQLAQKHHTDDFKRVDGSAGALLMFNNKNFHAVEPWKCPTLNREVYVIRLMPLYDIKIKFRKRIHGLPANNILIDFREETVRVHDEAVDVSRIDSRFKLPL